MKKYYSNELGNKAENESVVTLNFSAPSISTGKRENSLFSCPKAGLVLNARKILPRRIVIRLIKPIFSNLFIALSRFYRCL